MHGDEGVGLRESPLLEICWGPVERESDHSLSHNFFWTVVPHHLYARFNLKSSKAGNQTIDKLMAAFAAQANNAYYQGVKVEGKNYRFYLVFAGGASGDLVWLAKAFHLERNFHCNEICPKCDA